MLQNIPTHVIAGPLGAGKTSLIKHLLAQRPANERWAALPVGLAAVYGGYFGAGLSVIVLAVLAVVLDDNLTRLNALKQAVAFATNAAAAVFFVFSGPVVWQAAAVMAVGALIGGVLGGKLAGRIRPASLRYVVVTIGVVVGAVLIWVSGWTVVDPIISAIIALVILFWSGKLLWDAARILLQSTPRHLRHDRIAAALEEGVAGIRGVHHIHVWELTSRMYVMTAHVEVDDMLLSESEAIRLKALDLLARQFGITHANLEFESKR